ncbi:ECF transporter S component [Microbacterium paludicola]|uniref:ECF transporter S component n=1 Tax=Microbacterium paludicola TaxID=300019 RepID=UPI00387973A7
MNRVSTAYLLTCAVLGVAAAILLAPANWLSTVLLGVAPLASQLLTGLWILPAVVALRLLQRPGAALLTALISGLVLLPFSGWGLASVLTNVMFALPIELAFAAALYRRWATWQYYAGAAATAIIYCLWQGSYFGIESMTPLAVVAFYALAVLSCVAATTLGILIADRLHRAGVAATVRPKASRATA